MKTITFKLDEFKEFIENASMEEIGRCDERFYGEFMLKEDGAIFEHWYSFSVESTKDEFKIKGEVKEE